MRRGQQLGKPQHRSLFQAPLMHGVRQECGGNIAVVGFAQIVDKTQQKHPFGVQPGAARQQNRGQHCQPPGMLGRALVPAAAGPGSTGGVFQALQFPHKLKLLHKVAHYCFPYL